MSRFSYFNGLPKGLLRDEMRKLVVEMQRCQYYRRQHIPVWFVLRDARWLRKHRAAIALKKRKIYQRKSDRWPS